MKVLDRFFVFLFSLVVIALGVGAIFTAFEREYVVQAINYMLAFGGPGFGWIYLAIGVALVLLGVVIMFAVAFRRSKKEKKAVDAAANTTASKTAAGDVEVSAAAVNAIVAHAIAQVIGVKSVGNDFKQTAEGLVATLKITIEGEQNIVAVSEQLKAKVREDLENLAGLKVADVKVTVTDVNIGTASK